MSSCSPPLSHHRALTSLISEQWLIKRAYRPTWFLCWHVRCFDFEHRSSIQTHQGVFSVGSQSRSGEWEAEESGRICRVSAANTWKFMYESHNKHILHGGIEAKGWGGGLLQASRPLLMLGLIGWLVGWGGRNRTQCITAPAAFSGLWMALGNLLLPIHSHWTLSHVENITHHMFIHCWCRFGGVVSSVVCGGLGSTQWPCCHLSYTRRNFMHPSIHHGTTVPPLSSVSN